MFSKCWLVLPRAQHLWRTKETFLKIFSWPLAADGQHRRTRHSCRTMSWRGSQNELPSCKDVRNTETIFSWFSLCRSRPCLLKPPSVSYDVARSWQNAAKLLRAARTQEVVLKPLRNISFSSKDTKFVSASNVERVSGKTSQTLVRCMSVRSAHGVFLPCCKLRCWLLRP